MQHLKAWFATLEPAIEAAVALQSDRIARLRQIETAGGAITPDHARALASEGLALLREGYPSVPAIAVPPGDTDPPLAALLNGHERAALAIIAAGELSPPLARLFGFLHDDLARQHASVDLLLLLTAGDPVPEPQRRHDFGPEGRLAQYGLVVHDPLPRLGQGVLGWLTGARPAPPLSLSDPARIARPRAWPLPEHPETELALALITAGHGVAAMFGPGDRSAAAEGLAAACGRPLLRLPPPGEGGMGPVIIGLARATADAALAHLDLDLWPETVLTDAADPLGHCLAGCRQPVVLTRRSAWRSPLVIAAGPYAEIPLAETPATVAAARLAALTGLDAATATDLTGRYRFSAVEQGLFSQLAADRPIEAAAKLAAAASATSHARLITPHRTAADLVLPPDLHRQILEIPAFFAAAHSIDERWGFGRLSAAPGALKALFTGDPGTGKTLAAEVVAHELGRPLLKVDLAQVTSKWIGETEKNLEQVFEAAERTAAILFFDEAETLFGKRGEVRHGTDRYANLEVGYLLQRLESYRGLAILASNLRDEIDPAFIRRFQILLHFPRPAESERRRLWEAALSGPDGVPADIDWAALTRVDLTGAGIVSSARLAALIAAGRGQEAPNSADLNEAIVRQFRQEARLLRIAPAARA